jgi:hypothetical protein
MPCLTKHQTLCGETEKFCNVKLAGTYFNHCTLRDNHSIISYNSERNVYFQHSSVAHRNENWNVVNEGRPMCHRLHSMYSGTYACILMPSAFDSAGEADGSTP